MSVIRDIGIVFRDYCNRPYHLNLHNRVRCQQDCGGLRWWCDTTCSGILLLYPLFPPCFICLSLPWDPDHAQTRFNHSKTRKLACESICFLQPLHNTHTHTHTHTWCLHIKCPHMTHDPVSNITCTVTSSRRPGHGTMFFFRGGSTRDRPTDCGTLLLVYIHIYSLLVYTHILIYIFTEWRTVSWINPSNVRYTYMC